MEEYQKLGGSFSGRRIRECLSKQVVPKRLLLKRLDLREIPEKERSEDESMTAWKDLSHLQ